jgi:hypothetical protein
MVSLVLRPSTLEQDKPWALQLRWHGMAETTYFTIVRISESLAQEIIDAGTPTWLFGDPDKECTND